MDNSEFPAPAVMKFFYTIGTIAITIIMLNLLIAIIGTSY